MSLNLDRQPIGSQPVGGPGVTRFARRGDHRLSYESSGAADGIPVLALHDLLADRGQLRSLGQTPYDATFRATLPDARGHGASAMLSGRGYPASELAADIQTILDAEGQATVHIAAIGWSVATALALAVAAPARVRSLVLAAPYMPVLLSENPQAAAQQEGRRHLEMLREAATAAQKGQTESGLDLFLGMRMGSDWRERFSKPRLGAIRRAAVNLGPLLSGMAADTIDRDLLRKLQSPVTLLIGEDAPALARDTVDALASLFPDARIAPVPSAPGDQPAPGSEWTEAIARALQAHAAWHNRLHHEGRADSTP